MTAREKIIEILVNDFGCPADIEDSANLQTDLGLDSLAEVEMVMAFEEELDIDIMDEEAEHWRTVGDVVKTVGEKMGDG